MSDFFNSYDVDALDSSDEEEESQDATDQVLDSLDSPQPDVASEVIRRFSLAQYYMEIIKNPIFTDSSPEAQQVDREMREFATSRMEELVGIKKAKLEGHAVESPFTDEEVMALKSLASKVIKKPTLLESAPKPEIQKIQPPTRAPQVTPVPARAAQSPAPKRPVAKPSNKTKAGQKAEINNIPDGQPFKVGSKVYQWETNELGTRFKKDITKQATSSSAVRGPTSKEELEMIMERQAQESLKTTNIGSGSMSEIAAVLAMRK